MELERLGRYVVDRVLGRGAMGIVYLARDPVIGRMVALKTLASPADSEEAGEFRQRFMREAQAAGILNHPGIVTVHDAGIDEPTGLSYIAMEYIEGRSLKELEAGGYAFTYSEIARIGAAIAAALDYAHGKGVVHRDIKPANILITSQGHVKITDFGVARLESSNLTATGQFIGTPNYMSPEQITGGLADGRSDLFALGVVLFELLAGGRPFVGSSLTEVSYKIVHGPRPIPSQKRPGVPGAFNPIVLKLLERDPERRYARGADVARALEALRRVLSGLPAPAPEPPHASSAPPEVASAETLRAEAEGSATATSATVLPSRLSPDIWRRPLATRWALILLAAVSAPVVLVVLLLAIRVDRGPFAGPAPGEAARRHLVVSAQRQAAAAIADGHPERVEEILAPVWDQAPYSLVARDLLARSRATAAAQSRRRVDEARASALLDEGKALLGAGRFEGARERFAQVRALLPGSPLADLATQYVELASARSSSVPHAAAYAARPMPAPTVAAAALPATATIDVYFNSPLNNGSVELELDGRSLGKLPFDFSKRGFLGLKKKGTGEVEGSFDVPAGNHRLVVRLKGENDRLLGEEAFAYPLAGGARYTLKIEMESERVTPRFSLRPR
jgi:eukaryotic-like serine/threonine-protein kinase